MNKGELKSGYTTGACAAAGVKAALLYRRGQRPQQVEITSLGGEKLQIPIKAICETSEGIQVEVVKYSGDDPDITDGVSVFTRLKLLSAGAGLVFKAGEGIGRITKPGLALPVGEPAINPGPRELMRRTAEEVLGTEANLEITVSIPAGKELAARTLNPVLGIEGGLSVIGTTGVLRPMSEEAFKNSLVPQIAVARAEGYKKLIFVPGKIGENIAVKFGLPQGATIQMSNFVGFMLEEAAKRNIEAILLFGHLGKLAKVAAGVFHTHNRVADARMETLAAYAGAAGLSSDGLEEILASATSEEALAVLDKAGLTEIVAKKLAQRVSYRAERYLFGQVQVGAVLVTLRGRVLGMDDKAVKIGEEYHWRIR